MRLSVRQCHSQYEWRSSHTHTYRRSTHIRSRIRVYTTITYIVSQHPIDKLLSAEMNIGFCVTHDVSNDKFDGGDSTMDACSVFVTADDRIGVSETLSPLLSLLRVRFSEPTHSYSQFFTFIN